MAELFNCPACGAGLDYDRAAQPDNAATVECPYCHNSVIVPAELRPPAAMSVETRPAPEAQPEATVRVQRIKLTPQQTRWIWIVILVAFVLPSCITIGVSLLGVILGIAAPLLAILLPWLLGAR